MPGIFPNTKLLAGEENDGLPLTVQPRAGCDAMYYNEKCTQKPDYKALNALLSEIVSIINACPTSRYDCSSRANLLAALDCLYALPGCPTTTDCYELQCNGGTVSWQPCEVVPNIPDPPAAGCYELKSNNGAAAWEACPTASASSGSQLLVDAHWEGYDGATGQRMLSGAGFARTGSPTWRSTVGATVWYTFTNTGLYQFTVTFSADIGTAAYGAQLTMPIFDASANSMLGAIYTVTKSGALLTDRENFVAASSSANRTSTGYTFTATHLTNLWFPPGGEGPIEFDLEVWG